MAEPGASSSNKGEQRAMLGRLVALVALVGLVIYIASRAGGATGSAGSAPASAAAGSTNPEFAHSSALTTPSGDGHESVCELGVVTRASDEEVESATNDEGLLGLIEPRFCGASCDAVKEFVAHPLASDHQFDVEPATIEDWPLPPKETWSTAAKGLSGDEKKLLASATRIVIVHAREQTTRSHLAFRTCLAITAALAHKLSGFVYDEVARRVEAPRDFDKHLIKSRVDEPAFRPDHVALQSYVDENGEPRMLTLGMLRFGAPDVVARGFNPASESRLALLVNAVAAKLASPEHVSPLSISKEDVAQANGIAPRLLGPSDARGEVAFATTTDHAEGDPDNELVIIVPVGENRAEAFDTLVRQTTGSLDTLTLTENLPALNELARRVRASLPRIIAQHAAQGHLHLKADFQADGGTESMWVAVTSCDRDSCSGTLENRPIVATTLALGGSVTVRFADVVDYMASLPDGGVAGGESTRIIEGH